MPRHNFCKVQPQVMELCKKHGLTFEVLSLWEAFEDIVTYVKLIYSIFMSFAKPSFLFIYLLINYYFDVVLYVGH